MGMEKFMSQYEEFCNKLGNKYKSDFESVCNDGEYNFKKALYTEMDIHQYIQAAAEQVFYYKLKKQLGTIIPDKNVNPENGTDVDLYYDGKPYNLRIEVKTPVLFENTKKYKDDINNGITIHGQQVNRYPEAMVSRKDMAVALSNVIKAFNGKAAERKMEDNKIKDYLEGAQSKMVNPDDNTINALLICTSSRELPMYFEYIVNPYTGLGGKEPYISKEVYSKIDVIILSNCVEGHLDKNLRFNVWDADKYVNFVIPNTFRKRDNIYISKLNYMKVLFNDNFCKYCALHDKYTIIDGTSLDDRIGMINYLTEEHIMFAPNDALRKY